MTATASKPMIDKGLASTIAAESAMSFIDGEKGVLEYVGIDIDDLARKSTFEETVYLLWHLRLPSKSELETFSQQIRAEYELPEPMWDLIGNLPKTASPMHAIRTLISALALHDPEADVHSPEANTRKGIRILAKTPALIANFDRHRKGLDFIKPDKSMDMATAFLTMLNGEKPTDTMAKALDVCLILHADHGFNASTFASLVTISTLSDMYSAVTTAVGTLKGPLHGGANEAVMHTLKELNDVSEVEDWVKGKLERKERIMGFGHRVYKAYDPRARIFGPIAKLMTEKNTENKTLYEIAAKLEEIVVAELGMERKIFPNVDFYSGIIYKAMGIDTDMFTPIFAVSRIAGWTARALEYLADNRLFRPRAVYTGPTKNDYKFIEDR